MSELSSPNTTPIPADAKNMRQNLPMHLKKVTNPLMCANSGFEDSVTVLTVLNINWYALHL